MIPLLPDFFKEGILLFREVHKSKWNPVGLEEQNVLLFFRNFKKAIDTKKLAESWRIDIQ